MKSIKQKYGELIKEGFSKKTLTSLTEGQISHLHELMIGKSTVSEQVKQTTKQVTTTTIPQSTAKTTGANVGNVDIKVDPAGNVVATKMEGEMAETKDKKTNPWAICTSTMGKKFGTKERSEWSEKQLKEYERCVMDIKSTAKKNKKKIEEELEHHIVKLVEKHISPKMTKKQLLNMVEQAPIEKERPVETPVKPDTKPATRPSHPGRNPNPGVNPAPKAKKSEENMKDDIMDIIAKILAEK